MSIGERVTVTVTREHGLGFVVPTVFFYDRGPGDPPGNRQGFTCRDCDNEATQGHAPTCPQAKPRLVDLSSSARARRRPQADPPFTVFTLLFWIAVGIAVSTPLLGVLLYALGLLEFRR